MIDLKAAIFLCGLAHFGILIASSLVPFRLDWREELKCLPKLHRQMYWVYGGYVVFNIISFGIICTIFAEELASGSPLARAFCACVSAFWTIRLFIQPIFDVKDHLNTWWLRAGYHALTLIFLAFSITYGYAAFH